MALNDYRHKSINIQKFKVLASALQSMEVRRVYTSARRAGASTVVLEECPACWCFGCGTRGVSGVLVLHLWYSRSVRRAGASTVVLEECPACWCFGCGTRDVKWMAVESRFSVRTD